MRTSKRKQEHRPTILDIAHAADVSTWTVSHVLNARTDVSIADETRARVLAVAHELDYRPNSVARALVSGKTGLIALWMIAFDAYSSYYGRVSHCVQRLVKASDLQCVAEDVPVIETRTENWSRLLGWPVDGVLACDVDGPARAYLKSEARSRAPLVTFGAFCVEDADFVQLALEPGTRQAIEHLVSVGCRRIAYVCPPKRDMRADTYDSVLNDAGLPTEYIFTHGDSRPAARAAIIDYIREHGCPDGVFCQNDDRAIGVYRGLRDLDIRVPGDVALVGCDGTEDAEFYPCSISSIITPFDTMCGLAWQYLLNRIQDPTIPLQQSVIEPALVIRESSKR